MTFASRVEQGRHAAHEIRSDFSGRTIGYIAGARGWFGEAILDGIGAQAPDQLRPLVLFVDVIEDIGDQHAIILNRTRQASMVMPGETLLVYEMNGQVLPREHGYPARVLVPGRKRP